MKTAYEFIVDNKALNGFWYKNPAFRLLLFASVGFLLNRVCTFTSFAILILDIVALLLWVFSLCFKNIIPQWIVYTVAAICIGIFISFNAQAVSVPCPDKIVPESRALIKGQIVDIINQTPKSMRCLVEGTVDTKVLPAYNNCRAVISVYKLDEKDLNLQIGNEILGFGEVRLPEKHALKDDFDEDLYAKSYDIQFFGRVKAKDVSILSEPYGIYYIRKLSYIQMNTIINQLNKASVQGLTLALLTGDKSRIDRETRDLYSFSGTAHVLAVSGLHITVLAWIVYVFLGFIPNKWLKFLFYIGIIGAFIFFTGMQASAVRSGIMASLVMFAYTMERRISLINVLSFSIILLLLFEPYLIYSSGFQMSVASVLGIALLYKPIKESFMNLFQSTNKILIYIIDSVSVTLSASIIVSPIVAYYFNMFSVVSVLTNLFVIPLTSLAMIFSIFAMGFYFINIEFAGFYASASDLMLILSNEINKLALKIPFSYSKGTATLAVSLIVSVIVLYICTSNNRRLLSFRCTVALIAIFAFLTLFPEAKDKTSEIIPRQNIVFAKLKLKNNQTLVYLSDRKAKLYPALDYGILNYIKKIHDDLIVAVDGNCGIALTDALKKLRKIKIIESDFILQSYIQQFFRLKEKIPQLIYY